MVDEQHIGHRMRCVTVRVGVVNVCPNCGYANVHGFTWDFRRDPEPGLGTIILSEDNDSLEVFIDAMKELAPTVAMPCIPSCESRGELDD